MHNTNNQLLFPPPTELEELTWGRGGQHIMGVTCSASGGRKLCIAVGFPKFQTHPAFPFLTIAFFTQGSEMKQYYYAAKSVGFSWYLKTVSDQMSLHRHKMLS